MVKKKDCTLREQLLCRGYLFLYRSLAALSDLETLVPNINHRLLRYRTDEGQWRIYSIRPEQMDTFRLVTESRLEGVAYDDCTVTDGHPAIYNSPGHPFHGREGTLIRRRGKLFIVFTLSGLPLSKLPELEVQASQITPIC